MTDDAPLFASDHVTVPVTTTAPFTYDDLVRFYRQIMDMPHQPYVNPLPSPMPLLSASDHSGYAEYLLTGHYPLNADIAERCAP